MDEWIGGGDVIACDVPPGTVCKGIRGATASIWTDSTRSLAANKTTCERRTLPIKHYCNSRRPRRKVIYVGVLSSCTIEVLACATRLPASWKYLLIDIV